VPTPRLVEVTSSRRPRRGLVSSAIPSSRPALGRRANRRTAPLGDTAVTPSPPRSRSAYNVPLRKLHPWLPSPGPASVMYGSRPGGAEYCGANSFEDPASGSILISRPRAAATIVPSERGEVRSTIPRTDVLSLQCAAACPVGRAGVVPALAVRPQASSRAQPTTSTKRVIAHVVKRKACTAAQVRRGPSDRFPS
jgi:hypothetical protein